MNRSIRSQADGDGLTYETTGQVLRGLIEIARGHLWTLPVLVGLNLTAFLFEGLAIYMLFPLVEILARGEMVRPAEATDNALLAFLGQALSAFPPERHVQLLVAGIVVCIGVKGFVSFASQASFAWANGRIADGLRRRCFDDILSADAAFLDRQRPGALLNSLATQTWAVSDGLKATATMVTHACAASVFVLLMFALDWKMTLLVGLVVICALSLVQLATRSAMRVGNRAVAVNEALAGEMVENLAGLRTLKLFNAENVARARFAETSKRVRHAFVQMEVLAYLPAPLLELTFAVLIGVFLLLIQGDGSIGPIVVFLALLNRLQPHASQLMQTRTAMMTLAGALNNLQQLKIEAKPAGALANLPEAPNPRVAIALDGVTFTFHGAERPALHDIDVRIPAGKVTALTGRSGAGKSTILGLICRLSVPDAGRVTVDGHDLAEFDAASWRDRCAIVPQDIFLFNATLAENIALGRPGASLEEIEEATRLAQANGFIRELPDGLNTIVGDRGTRLSGGQRQRIALARAFVRRPEILILDEATNALDSYSERLVVDAIEAERGKRIVIVIAHRLSSIERADHVVVLDAGSVIETGKPSELLSRKSEFTKLFGGQRGDV